MFVSVAPGTPQNSYAGSLPNQVMIKNKVVVVFKVSILLTMFLKTICLTDTCFYKCYCKTCSFFY